MWMIYEELKPRCPDCGKPMKAGRKDVNDYLPTEMGRMAEIHIDVPTFTCCGIELESPRGEIAKMTLAHWAQGIDPFETLH